jgi:signal transduction histidine kinase
MMKYFFSVVLIAVSLSAQAQETSLDWYKAFYSERPSDVSARLKSALERASEFLQTNDPANAAKAYKEAGMLYMLHSHDFSKAMDQFINSLSIEDTLALSDQKIITQLAIAELNIQVGDEVKAREWLETALQSTTDVTDELALFIRLKLGEINSHLNYPDEARAQLNNVLNNAADNDYTAKADALFLLAAVSDISGKKEEAMSQHKLALDLRRKAKDAVAEAVSLSHIGDLYFRMDNYEKALANHRVALDIRRRVNDSAAVASSLNSLAQIYLQNKDYRNAILTGEDALKTAHEAQDQNAIRKSYELLSAAYKAEGEFEKSLANKELAVAMTELIVNERSEQQVIASQNLYEVKRKEGEIQELQKIRKQKERELAQQRKTEQQLYMIIAAGFVIAILLVWLYLLKRRSNKMLVFNNRRISEQNEQLHEANATKDKFFSIISHDLKGPLNSLTSFSSLLIHHTDSLTKDEIQMLAKDLDKSLKNLFDLLENLLEWSRSQTGNIDFKREEFDVAALVRTTVELLSVQAANKSIKLTASLPDGCRVMAHRHSVNTVIRNLISNALKFTPASGTVTVSARTDGDMLTIAVADSGVGMPREVLTKLFRIDTKYTTKGTADERGTGLGLILCKEFVEKNGGTIKVESEEGKGSVFTFTLPKSSTVVTAL